MGPLGRLYAERGYQVIVQSCRGTFGSGGEFVPVRNEQADGRATLEWVAAPALVRRPPRHVGRELPRHDAVGRGAGRAGLRPGAQPAGDRGELPRLGRVPGWCVRARDGSGLAARDQEPGARVAHRPAHAPARCPGGVDASAVLPIGKCDTAAIGEPMAFYQDWLEHSAPGDPWWDAVDFGRRLEKVPPASFIGGWYDLFLKAQVDDYEALRRAGRTARLTIGPWTHTSPALFAETVRDGPRWFDSQLGAGPGGAPGRAGAPLRHGVAHLAGSSRCGRRRGRPSGGTSDGVARCTPSPPPDDEPATAPRTGTTTTRTTPRRPWADRRSTWPRRGARTSAAARSGATC